MHIYFNFLFDVIELWLNTQYKSTNQFESKLQRYNDT
ncbi:hypothetical protein PsAD26_03371 [Pseudovibrio sp. Ad26]|nr:hypothetical protein PsAD26_03371 [Pseudovibrio sp. Ad26]